jgi:hypothetical protein
MLMVLMPYKENQLEYSVMPPREEAGSNTSTVVLRVVGDDKGTQCLGI